MSYSSCVCTDYTDKDTSHKDNVHTIVNMLLLLKLSADT